MQEFLDEMFEEEEIEEVLSPLEQDIIGVDLGVDNEYEQMLAQQKALKKKLKINGTIRKPRKYKLKWLKGSAKGPVGKRRFYKSNRWRTKMPARYVRSMKAKEIEYMYTDEEKEAVMKLVEEQNRGKQAFYKKGMENIVVTSNGLTLDDILSKKYSKPGITMRNHIDNKIKDTLVAIERDKVYTDNAYVKKLEKQGKKDKEKKEKVKKKSTFVNNVGAYSERENYILRSMGITGAVAKKAFGPRTRLTEEDKMNIMNYSLNQTDMVRKNNNRKKLRKMDVEVLRFMEMFNILRYTHIVALWGFKKKAASASIKRLLEHGLIRELWYDVSRYYVPTTLGMQMVGGDIENAVSKIPEKNSNKTLILVAYVAACLYRKTINVIDDTEEDFMAKNRYLGDSDRKVLGETLVTEKSIRSAFSTRMWEMKQEYVDEYSLTSAFYVSNKIVGMPMKQKIFDEMKEEQRVFIEGYRNGDVGKDSGPESVHNEHYIIMPEIYGSDSYRVPDLVVVRDRNEDLSPNNIAIEIENGWHQSSKDRIERGMKAYKRDKYLYKKVIWITGSEKIAQQIRKAAQLYGLSEDKYEVLPFYEIKDDRVVPKLFKDVYTAFE